MKDMSSSLRKSDCILATESHRVYTTINISTSYMAKTQEATMDAPVIYIFSNFRDIYLITENICSKEGTDC